MLLYNIKETQQGLLQLQLSMTLTAGILCTENSQLLGVYACHVCLTLGMLPKKWSQLINHHKDVKTTPASFTPYLQELVPTMFGRAAEPLMLLHVMNIAHCNEASGPTLAAIIAKHMITCNSVQQPWGGNCCALSAWELI